MISPFEEDSAVSFDAARLGLSVYRRFTFDVDPKLLPAEYWRRTPHYSLIEKHRALSGEIPGVQATGRVEYVLRPIPV